MYGAASWSHLGERHKGLYEALKQGPVVTPEPPDDNAVEITLAECRQQHQAPREIWTVVPARPRMEF